MDIEKPLRPETLLKRYRNLEIQRGNTDSIVKVDVLSNGVGELSPETELLLKEAKPLNTESDVMLHNDDESETRESGTAHLSPFATESDAGQCGGEEEEGHDMSPEEKRPRIERPRAQYASSVRRTSAPACLWSATSLFSDQVRSGSTSPFTDGWCQDVVVAIVFFFFFFWTLYNFLIFFTFLLQPTTSASFQDNLTLLQKLLAKQRMKCPSASSSPDSGLGHDTELPLNDPASQRFPSTASPFGPWPWLAGMFYFS